MKAFVLKRKPYSESDLIVDFLLEDGKVFTGFARAGRKSKKRFSHQFHPLALYSIELGNPGSHLTEIRHCEMLQGVPTMELDFFTRWSLLVEFLLRDRESFFDFNKVENIFRLFSNAQGLSEYHRFFLDQIERHGLQPELDSCVICQKAIEGRRGFLSLEGGVVHLHCRSSIDLTDNVLKFLRSESSELSSEDFKILDSITVPFLLVQMGWESKALSFFRQVASPV